MTRIVFREPLVVSNVKIGLAPAYGIWLDDKRLPDDGADWVVVRTYEEFVCCIETRGMPAAVSLDHDLHPDHYNFQSHPIPYRDFEIASGFHCALFLKRFCEYSGHPLPKIRVHSWNKAGAENIIAQLGTGHWEKAAEKKKKRRNWVTRLIKNSGKVRQIR